MNLFKLFVENRKYSLWYSSKIIFQLHSRSMLIKMLKHKHKMRYLHVKEKM